MQSIMDSIKKFQTSEFAIETDTGVQQYLLSINYMEDLTNMIEKDNYR